MRPTFRHPGGFGLGLNDTSHNPVVGLLIFFIAGNPILRFQAAPLGSAMMDSFHDGLVNQHLLLQNEYLAAVNRILRGHLLTRLPDPTRADIIASSRKLRTLS